MNKLRNKILDLIITNKISSVEISDALGKSGVLDNFTPLNNGHFVAGIIEYICTFNNSNWELHKQLETTNKNRIIYIDSFNCNNRALFGDLVSKYAIYYKHAKALVVNGLVRDVHQLKKANYPIFAKGRTPLGCFNQETQLDNKEIEYASMQKKIFQDGILVCDDSGCTLIQKEQLTEELYEKLQMIELQEDIWYFCIDTLKLSTFETICKKSYLHDEATLKSTLHKKILSLQKIKK